MPNLLLEQHILATMLTELTGLLPADRRWPRLLACEGRITGRNFPLDGACFCGSLSGKVGPSRLSSPGKDILGEFDSDPVTREVGDAVGSTGVSRLAILQSCRGG